MVAPTTFPGVKTVDGYAEAHASKFIHFELKMKRGYEENSRFTNNSI